MKNLLIIIIFIASNNTSYAQPSWQIIPSDYAYNMSVFGIASDSCETSGDQVAVFDEDNNLRGFSLVDDEVKTFFMIVYSNETGGETLHFSYYDSESDEVFELTEQTFSFEQGGFIGSPTPLTISSPETVKPIVSCQSATIYVDQDGLAYLSASQIDNGSTDNCGSVFLSLNQEVYNCNHLGSVNATLIVTDGSGNQDSCTSVVTVRDTIPPVAICNNITVSLEQNGTTSIAPEEVDDNSTDNCGELVLSLSKSNFEKNEEQVQEIWLIVNDPSGQRDSCLAMITILNPFENSIVNCSDGLDNDNDGLTDCNDPGCIQPTIASIDITTPTSSDCLLSNADGQLKINHSNANIFSIDGGENFVANSTIDNVTSGIYPVIAMNNTTGCSDALTIDVINIFKPKVIIEDVTLNCTNKREGPLVATAVNGTPEFTYLWEDDMGQSYPDSALVQEGRYFVTVTDSNSCTDTSSILFSLATDPLLGQTPLFIEGPRTICPGMLAVEYMTEADTSAGNLSWVYDGDGVSITTLDAGRKVSVDYDNNTEEGILTLSYSNLCSEILNTLPISLGGESACLLANCPDRVSISTELIQSEGAPDIYRAATSLSTNAVLSDRNYIFSAGHELFFSQGFSIANGKILTADIKSCEN